MMKEQVFIRITESERITEMLCNTIDLNVRYNEGKGREEKEMHGKVVKDNGEISVSSPCFHQRIRVDYSI
jgi:hypothetical protein